jgi:hypothetical protein
MPGPLNPFDYFEHSREADGAGAYWLLRAPTRPDDGFDLRLIPRSPTWREEAAPRRALAQIEREPWVERLEPGRGGIDLRLDGGWMETVGGAWQQGDCRQTPMSDFAQAPPRFVVRFCDDRPSPPLHVGDLRGLALGHALAAGLTGAGARVERCSLDRRECPPSHMAVLAKLGIPLDRAPSVDSPQTRHIYVCEAGSLVHGAGADEPRDVLSDERQTYTVAYGSVAGGLHRLASREPAPSIEELMQWLEHELEVHPQAAAVVGQAGSPTRVAAQIALGYFLPLPTSQHVDLFMEKLVRARESPGWDLARACAPVASVSSASHSGDPVDDPAYRFAVVQAELRADQLRLMVRRLDPVPLARGGVQLARWYLQRARSPEVQRVVCTALGQAMRALGLQ